MKVGVGATVHFGAERCKILAQRAILWMEDATEHLRKDSGVMVDLGLEFDIRNTSSREGLGGLSGTGEKTNFQMNGGVNKGGEAGGVAKVMVRRSVIGAAASAGKKAAAKEDKVTNRGPALHAINVAAGAETMELSNAAIPADAALVGKIATDNLRTPPSAHMANPPTRTLSLHIPQTQRTPVPIRSGTAGSTLRLGDPILSPAFVPRPWMAHEVLGRPPPGKSISTAGPKSGQLGKPKNVDVPPTSPTSPVSPANSIVFPTVTLTSKSTSLNSTLPTPTPAVPTTSVSPENLICSPATFTSLPASSTPTQTSAVEADLSDSDSDDDLEKERMTPHSLEVNSMGVATPGALSTVHDDSTKRQVSETPRIPLASKKPIIAVPGIPIYPNTPNQKYPLPARSASHKDPQQHRWFQLLNGRGRKSFVIVLLAAVIGLVTGIAVGVGRGNAGSANLAAVVGFTTSTTSTVSATFVSPTPLATAPPTSVSVIPATSNSTLPRSANIYDCGTGGLVALTFNGGISPNNVALRNLLAKYNATATFFLVAKTNWTDLSVHGDTVKAIVQEGHQVASMGWSHCNFVTGGCNLTLEIDSATTLIGDILGGKKPTYFRFPYNSSTAEATQYLLSRSYKIVTSSIDTRDLEQYPPIYSANATASDLVPGYPTDTEVVSSVLATGTLSVNSYVVQMYETVPGFEENVEGVLQEVVAKGYVFVTGELRARLSSDSPPDTRNISLKKLHNVLEIPVEATRNIRFVETLSSILEALLQETHLAVTVNVSLDKLY
ncbi:hypothetical protein HDU93_001838 [Gonapodya sp. JEL0774]|nr:hypothetical protein HDU93_001838 [Gonapodya sp. JEL0774]